MGSWIGRVGVRSRATLRRALLLALVMVVAALAGGLPTNQTLAQPPGVLLNVNFSPQTPPLKPGVICKDQNYLIEVQPLVPVGEGIAAVPLFGAGVVSLTRPNLGTLNGSTEFVGRMVDIGGSVIFSYKAQRTGSETLNFGVLRAVRPEVLSNLGYLADPNFYSLMTSKVMSFEVVECHYKVRMAVKWNYSGGGIYLGAFAYLADTTLDLQPDGTFQGAGPFKFTYMASLGVCSADYSGFSVPTRVTGKLIPDTHELDLKFEFGPAQSSASFKCPGASGGTTRNEDVAKYVGVTEAKFPPEGAVKPFVTPGEGTGTFLVGVKPVTPGAQ